MLCLIVSPCALCERADEDSKRVETDREIEFALGLGWVSGGLLASFGSRRSEEMIVDVEMLGRS
jgi:hypothetical protein